ncbi:MAG: sugar phosphate isomerase/epimerase family protein [Bacteroidales bacterium]
MTKENQKTVKSISRRDFIGNVMFATAAAAMISGCRRPDWQLGCFTRPWGRVDYRVAFDGIAGAGFEYVGLMGAIITRETTPEQAAEVGKEAALRGFNILSVYGGFDVRNSVAEGIAQLQGLIDNSSICGCSGILMGGTTAPELVDPYYKVIAECCDYAAEKGVALNIKPHGGTNATGPECRQHIENVGHKNFRLWYDPGNIYYYSGGEIDPVDDAATVDGIVVGMCVKDFLPPKEVNVTPGNGMVDFPKVMSRLQQGGFTAGPLLVECLSQGDLDFINAEAIKARQFLEELIS